MKKDSAPQGAPLGQAAAEQQTQAVLKARARALAQEEPAELAPQESLKVITFLLASETYGLESTFVRGVHPLKDFTPLPGTPPLLLGIVNLRGQIVSVVDLKKFFSLPEKGLGELNKVILIGDGQMEFGVLADVILGTRSVALDDIRQPPPTVTGIGAQYLRGVTGERLIIIDAQQLLGDEKIVVHQEVE
ncbi:MAG: chemotaxis protein CheW [Thermodesulfobacteriota bacterium]